jgi:hypothetical protein
VPRVRRKGHRQREQEQAGAAELEAMTDDQLQGEYDRLIGAWMARSDAGQRQTWEQFNLLDEVYHEQQRRRYRPAVVPSPSGNGAALTGIPGGKAHA